MKLKYLLGMLIAAFLLMSAGCQDDPDDVTDKRDNIVGSWHCTLNDGNVPEDYEIVISKDNSDLTKVYLSNFVNNGTQAVATITGFNLTVAQQQIGNSTVLADGVINTNYQEITWNITIDGDNYTATLVPGGITKVGQ